MRLSVILVLRSLKPRTDACLTGDHFELPRIVFFSISSLDSLEADLGPSVDFLSEINLGCLYLLH